MPIDQLIGQSAAEFPRPLIVLQLAQIGAVQVNEGPGGADDAALALLSLHEKLRFPRKAAHVGQKPAPQLAPFPPAVIGGVAEAEE